MSTVIFSGGTPLTLAGGPPGANGSYNIAGATAVLSGGMLDGWTINAFSGVSSMSDVSGSYAEIIYGAGSNVAVPGQTASYMDTGAWLGRNVGVGDFDWSAKVAMTNSTGLLPATSANTAAAVAFGRVISTTPNDSPIIGIRRGFAIPPAVRLGGGMFQSTGRSNILSVSPAVASNTAYWLRLKRTGNLIQAYYKLLDGDAWTELTSGATDYNVGGAGLILLALSFSNNERVRIYQYSFTGYAP